MNLPKNITQIGEADAKYKVFVEDYVVSFLKQLNPLARDKTMAAALYGRRECEGDKVYLFVYGAGKIDFIQQECRHLSQAQRQEIERIRKQYFEEYVFLGYRILDGDMVDGIHVYEQEICRYIAGYAQFYEKNEAMLSYMLESRQEEAAPESIDSEKYELVKDRQEKRRARYGKHMILSRKEKAPQSAGLWGLQAGAAAVFVLLCVLGLMLNSSMLEGKGFDLEKLGHELTEKKLVDPQPVSGNEVDVIVMQDMLGEAVQEENARAAADRQSEDTNEANTGFGVATAQNSQNTEYAGTEAQQGNVGEVRQEGVSGVSTGIGQAGSDGQENQNSDQKDTGRAQREEAGTVESQQTDAGTVQQGLNGQNEGSAGAGDTTGQSGQGTKYTGNASAAEQYDRGTEYTGGNAIVAEQSGHGTEYTGNASAAGQNDRGSEYIGGNASAAERNGRGTESTGDAGIKTQQEETSESVAQQGNMGTAQQEETADRKSNDSQEVPSTYIVSKGDTLIGISIRTYGNEKRVKEICKLNHIKNPDEIMIGQKILLP